MGEGRAELESPWPTPSAVAGRSALRGAGGREGTTCVACARTVEISEAVWPGPREAVRCEDWLEMKLPAASRDIVLCDGGLNLLAYPDEQQRLASILSEVL